MKSDQSSLFDQNMIIWSVYSLYEFTKHEMYLFALPQEINLSDKHNPSPTNGRASAMT